MSVNVCVTEPTVPKLMEVACFSDARGQLGVVEDNDLPFEIKRIYFQFDVPIGAVRGEHGHKKLQQFMICMNGACEITFNDGTQQFHFQLDKPSIGLLVPPGLWRSIRFSVPDSVLCVLASRPFESEDYIYSYEEYLAWVQDKEASRP